ncbi:MAG: membrane protein [Lysobacterales bacterium]|jgi:uncharacterized membrane protein YebE (DUF533 family)|nr:MAG: membrane protein [Xanthomonadales bacterium]
MSARGFLESLMTSAKDILAQTGLAERKEGGGLRISTLGKGAAIGAVAATLLRNKSLRRIGGVAALGYLAYRAVQHYKSQSAPAAPAGSAPSAAPLLAPPAAAEQPPMPEERAQALLIAIIHAAKADGHIDAAERTTIDRALAEQGDSPALRALIAREMDKPTDPHAVAALARDEQHAAEIYLASLMTVAEMSFMERAYLDALANALRLPPELKATLEREASSGG